MTNLPEVFIVDDERGVADMCADYLRPNYAVKVFSSAQEAIDEFDKGHEPDAVVTDIKMPGIDGPKLVQKLRERDFKKPIFMMSAYAEKKHAIQAMDLGVAGLLEKPFEPMALKEVLKKKLASFPSGKKDSLLTCYSQLAQAATKLIGKYRSRYVTAENILYEADLQLCPTKESKKNFLESIHTETELENEIDRLAEEIKSLAAEASLGVGK